MSTFKDSLEIGNPSQERFQELEAWVDTRGSYTLIPGPVLEGLGYSPSFRRPFRLADGSLVELDGCRAHLRIGGEVQFSLCIFGEEESEPLLGATALEEFGLGVDPLNHTLIPVVSNLLSFYPEAHDHNYRG